MSRNGEKARVDTAVLRDALQKQIDMHAAAPGDPGPGEGTDAWYQMAAGFADVGVKTLKKMLLKEPVTVSVLRTVLKNLYLCPVDLVLLDEEGKLPTDPG